MYTTGTIQANGQSLFYACQGEGRPVLLLHGNGGSHHDMEATAHVLEGMGYLVYSLDSRGQGANVPLSEYHYADMAEDVYQFILAAGLHQPAVFGWSDGGNVALQLEVMHPGTCSMIATSGSNIFPEGVGYGIIDDLKNEGPDAPPLHRMMIYEPTMSMSDMEGIPCPALICAGEHDLILEEHTRAIAEAIPQGEVMIIPDSDHSQHIVCSPRMGWILIDWLRRNRY